MSIIGNVVDLKEGQREALENTLGYKEALDYLFERLIQETKDSVRRTGKVWNEMVEIAKEQYPEFDKDTHTLSYSWSAKKLIIQNQGKGVEGFLR